MLKKNVPNVIFIIQYEILLHYLPKYQLETIYKRKCWFETILYELEINYEKNNDSSMFDTFK